MASMSLGTSVARTIYTGDDVKLDIDGVTAFAPPTGKVWRDLNLYANVALPSPGSAARESLARGGWRAWFQEHDKTEADGRDETGYLGPIAIPRFGKMKLLISHTWNHTVDADKWEFMIKVYAYDATGKAVKVPLTLTTRQIKFVE
jgi:hypothetical protein